MFKGNDKMVLNASTQLAGPLVSGQPVFLPAELHSLACENAGLKKQLADAQAALDRLQAETERLRSLAAISADWYWEQDANFCFTMFSPESVEYVRQSSQFDLDLGLGACRWGRPDAVALSMSWDEHRQLLQAHQPFRSFEYKIGDGDAADYFSISGVPVFEACGLFTGYRGTSRLITQRKRLEEQASARLLSELRLGQSEARYRAVVAALAEAVVVRDQSGCIIDCNLSAECILGKSLEQMRGQVFAAPEWQLLREDGSMMPLDEHPDVMARRTGLAQSNAVVCYRKPDGSDLWALINVQPLFEGPGVAPSGFVTSLTDISKRKRAELEVMGLNTELEHRVLRRTAQLEAANGELEAFSYSVAHDLRSPLGTIDGFCILLQKALSAGTKESMQHYIDRIRGGVRRMGELTNGLLSLAKLSRTSLKWEAVDLSTESERIIAERSESEPARAVQLLIQPGMTVQGDRPLLNQVLENLLGNAWKFSSKKARTEISVGQLELEPPVYFVRDAGAGFDPAYADKLFGTFERLHSPEEFAGSGIGLATVKRIITRHGGRVWAESVPGEGSSFYFTLGSEQSQSPGDGLTACDGEATAAPKVWRPAEVFGPAAVSGQVVRLRTISSDNDVFASSDLQFSTAFDHAPIGLALIGLDSRRLRVNSALCRMLGFSEVEMRSRSLRDVSHPDEVEWEQRQRERAIAGEIETYHREKRYLHQSGRVVWGYMTCSLVRDADHKPVHFIVQVLDIDERKHMEDALRASEARLRGLTGLSLDWFWEQDEHFRFVQISDLTDRASGKLAMGTDAIGKTLWELDFLNMDDEVWADIKGKCERHEAYRGCRVSCRGADGRIQYWSVSGMPLFDGLGRFSGYCGVGHDNTPMQEAHEALRVSELRLRQVTNAVPALMAYVDADQRFRFHNRACEDAFNLAGPEIEGKSLREVVGAALYKSMQGQFEKVLSGRPVVFERTLRTACGKLRDYVINFFPRYGDGEVDGQVTGFYGLATDITEVKQADRVRKEFVATVSRDLRPSLDAIGDTLELICADADACLPAALHARASAAYDDCERLDRFIGSMVDIELLRTDKSSAALKW
jgi:PAS domain S-box-containing protein